MFIDFDDIWNWVVDVAADRILEEAQKLADKVYRMFSNGRLKEIRIWVSPKMKTSRQAIVWGMGLILARSRLAREGKRLLISAGNGWIVLSLGRGRGKADGKDKTIDAWRGLLRIAEIWANIREQMGEIMETIVEKAPKQVTEKLLRVFEALDMLLLILSRMDQ